MTNLSRSLGNEPEDIINPQALSEEAVKSGKKCGFKVKVYDEKEIKDLNMKAFLAVSRGSSFKPSYSYGMFWS